MYLQRGSRYTRREVSELFGVSNQGGIILSRRHPIVILYSDGHGEEFGYQDMWREDGFYHYTGAGQLGDMQMVRGNKAIRDHAKQGKLLLLLIETDKRRNYRFEGVMEYVDHYEKEIPDQNGGLRRAYIFRLRAVEDVGPDEDPMVDEHAGSASEGFGVGPGVARNVQAEVEIARRRTGISSKELRERAIQSSSPVAREVDRMSTYRQRSDDVRSWVLARAHGFCEGCGKPAPFSRASDGSAYLEPHHIDRVADDGLDAPSSVIALCPTCHRRAHYGADRAEYNERFKRFAQATEQAYEAGRILVVTAAIISNPDGKVLVCQRGSGSLAGRWEFPGGKVKEGERPEDCIKREIEEELRIGIKGATPFMMTDYDYDDFYIRLISFECSADGTPVLTEHRDAKWVEPSRLDAVGLAPADIAIGRRLAKRG